MVICAGLRSFAFFFHTTKYKITNRLGIWLRQLIRLLCNLLVHERYVIGSAASCITGHIVNLEKENFPRTYTPINNKQQQILAIHSIIVVYCYVSYGYGMFNSSFSRLYLVYLHCFPFHL